MSTCCSSVTGAWGHEGRESRGGELDVNPSRDFIHLCFQESAQREHLYGLNITQRNTHHALRQQGDRKEKEQSWKEGERAAESDSPPAPWPFLWLQKHLSGVSRWQAKRGSTPSIYCTCRGSQEEELADEWRKVGQASHRCLLLLLLLQKFGSLRWEKKSICMSCWTLLFLYFTKHFFYCTSDL